MICRVCRKVQETIKPGETGEFFIPWPNGTAQCDECFSAFGPGRKPDHCSKCRNPDGPTARCAR